MKRLLHALTLILMGCAAAGPVAAQEVTVFAAASLTNALTEVGERFAATGQGRIKPSFAASSGLAKQIENGSPAHLFISADLEWMDYLASRRLIDPASRMNLFGNSLVLIAPSDSKLSGVAIDSATSLAKLAGDGRIVTGDPDHVPVGKYARQAFQALGQWNQIEPKLARVDSVRAALALVERGEVPLGVVYATDAAMSRKVKVLATFPANLHAPVVYPAALVAAPPSPAAKAFLAFLAGPEAKGIFARHGFRLN
ncbi:molybdate transporter subunit; periplasmic-binding component of ABC superfamily [Magnetospirillum sp. LM-5]|uniref:molybdate ABC transporter substrate-binding protein n=1 Tax=Magnetospirillum sp. LM-5 TaxID=2681466 RepID=UPI00138533F8|nr:molybdate ABC transporter substrate-binding protein [Magnetospirillum sp. LM-5]CAA7613323.1 molybdate transporter subunit; periplasmic-binding component of ABC superfamily [Magnetospirillum sp. LM-5]